MDFDLHRLRLLRELHHRGTISAVAEALSYSPGTISQQLSILQREIGLPLLEPVGRRVRLTGQALLLVKHTEAVLAQLERAEAELARTRAEVIGTVRVAAFQTAMLTLVPQALTWLAEHHPGLQVEVAQTEVLVARAGLLPIDFDLVIDEVYPGHPRSQSDLFDQRTLVRDRLCLATARSEPDREGLEHYADADWIMEPEGSPAKEWVMALCRQAGFEPRVVHTSSDMVIHAQLVASGHAIAVLPDLIGAHRPEGVRLRHMRPSHRRSIVVTTRSSSRHLPTMQAVQAAFDHAAEAAGIRH